MGAIVAIEKDGVVYLAADANKECCGGNFYVNKESNLRLHKMPSGIIVATIGPMHTSERLWLHDEWFELAEGEVFDKKFIVTKLIPRFYESIKDMDVWETNDNKMVNMLDAMFILAKGADIYVILNDLSVFKGNKIVAISDEDKDRCSMFFDAMSCSEKDPEKLLKKTFESVARRTSQVSTHGFIINTRDFTLKKMEDVE